MTDKPTSVDATVDSTAEHLNALIHEAEAVLGCAKADASANLDDIRARLRDAIDQGKGMASNLGQCVKRQAGRADDTIRANPYASIGVAAGIGLVVGLLLAGRFRSQGGN